MASGTARGRVRTTDDYGVAQMVAVLQKRDIRPWFTVYFFDIGQPGYDQLTPVLRDHISGSSLQLIEVTCFCEGNR